MSTTPPTKSTARPAATPTPETTQEAAAAAPESPRTAPRPTDAASRAKWKRDRAIALGDLPVERK